MTGYDSLGGNGSGPSSTGGAVCHWLKHMKLYRVVLIVVFCLLSLPFVFYNLLVHEESNVQPLTWKVVGV